MVLECVIIGSLLFFTIDSLPLIETLASLVISPLTTISDDVTKVLFSGERFITFNLIGEKNV